MSKAEMRTVKSSSGVQLVEETISAGLSGRIEMWCVMESWVASRSVLFMLGGRGGDRVGIRRSNSCGYSSSACMKRGIADVPRVFPRGSCV